MCKSWITDREFDGEEDPGMVCDRRRLGMRPRNEELLPSPQVEEVPGLARASRLFALARIRKHPAWFVKALCDDLTDDILLALVEVNGES